MKPDDINFHKLNNICGRSFRLTAQKLSVSDKQTVISLNQSAMTETDYHGRDTFLSISGSQQSMMQPPRLLLWVHF